MMEIKVGARVIRWWIGMPMPDYSGGRLYSVCADGDEAVLMLSIIRLLPTGIPKERAMPGEETFLDGLESTHYWVAWSRIHKDRDGKAMVRIGGALFPLSEARVIASELLRLFSILDTQGESHAG